MEESLETITALLIGIGLSAACGFRIFVPLLGMSIAHHAGYLTLAPDFEWIGSWPATLAFAIATMVEVGGYYLPWVDNVLDSIATPGAMVAGALATASVFGDASPFWRWSLAVIAGGGIAGIIQGSSVLVRATSTAVTGGTGNPVLATWELLAAIAGTILSILLPFIAFALAAILVFLVLGRLYHRRQGAPRS